MAQRCMSSYLLGVFTAAAALCLLTLTGKSGIQSKSLEKKQCKIFWYTVSDIRATSTNKCRFFSCRINSHRNVHTNTFMHAHPHAHRGRGSDPHPQRQVLRLNYLVITFEPLSCELSRQRERGAEGGGGGWWSRKTPFLKSLLLAETDTVIVQRHAKQSKIHPLFFRFPIQFSLD